MSIDMKIQKRLSEFVLNVEMKSESQRIGILGASGSGKSMTLKSIAGIETPDKGYIRIDGKLVFDAENKSNQKPQQRNIGYLFQNYALFPTMSVRENIAAGVKGKKAERREKAEEMLLKFHLHGLGERLPGELSGGQQQRVALARIMAYEPDIILLDEPFSALDVFLKDRLQQEMQEMLEEYKGTVILVSHSRDEIYRFSEELVIMDEGHMISYGKTRQIFENPGNVQAARLTGCKNIVSVNRQNQHTLLIPDWGISLKLKQHIPEGTGCIGIRAHDFQPVWGEAGENCLPFHVNSTAELPFEKKFFLRSGITKAEEICWFVQREQWSLLEEKGLPDYLKIPEEKVLLL